jgi:DNA invertase Pin-like site-specific DNA recombinase
MIYGYARVSTQDQNLDTQIEQLTKFGVDEVVKEKISGVSKQKQQLDELLSKITTGDTLVVDSNGLSWSKHCSVAAASRTAA